MNKMNFLKVVTWLAAGAITLGQFSSCTSSSKIAATNQKSGRAVAGDTSDLNADNRPMDFYQADSMRDVVLPSGQPGKAPGKSYFRNLIWQPSDQFFSKFLPPQVVAGLIPTLSLYQKRYLTLFILVRGQPVPMFEEFRRYQPLFKIPGENGLRDVVVASRYESVMQAFGTDAKGTLLDTVPLHLKTPYNEHGMDETLAGDKNLVNKERGAFMLGRDGDSSGNPHMAHTEKAPQRYMMSHVNGNKDVADQRVREITLRLTREAIRDGIDGNQLDIAKNISRSVALKMVSEYFGFYGPGLPKFTEWSKATQHAFFHNSFIDAKIPLPAAPGVTINDVEPRSIQAGTEMSEWLKSNLIPEMNAQLENGQPAYNTVSQMMKHKWSGDKQERLMNNIMGLLVGAGETSTISIVNVLQYLGSNPKLLAEAVRLAKLTKNNTNPKDKNNILFDQYVWESLRIVPLNPWVTRYATEDFTMSAAHEGDSSSTMDLNIKEKSIVLVAMASGSRDSDYFNNPNDFVLDRSKDKGRYIHTSFGYHECLGADVVYQMLPEIVKQVLANLNDIDFAYATTPTQPPTPNGLPNKLGGPFPEQWLFKFASSDLTGASAKKTIDTYVQKNFATDLAKLSVGVASNDVQTEIDTAYDLSKSLSERNTAIDKLMSQVTGAYTDEAKSTADCKKGKLPTGEIVGDIRKDFFCKTPHAFRACFLVQKSAGNRSTEHAYNYCAFGKQLLSSDARSAFKKKMFLNNAPKDKAYEDGFRFLSYQ